MNQRPRTRLRKIWWTQFLSLRRRLFHRLPFGRSKMANYLIIPILKQ